MTTVLMAVLQGEKFLKEQLDSILGQTVSVDRIVVSDDGSNDGTMLLLKRYQEQYPDVIEILHHKKPGEEESAGSLTGAAANFFFLLNKEAGKAGKDSPDYWFLSDQDDIWLPDKVGKMLKEMHKVEKAEGEQCPILLHSDMKLIDASGIVFGNSFFSYQGIDPERVEFSEILVENPVTGGAALINRPLLEYLQNQPGICVMHDWWLALIASCFGRVVCIRTPTSMYRQHQDNTLGAKKIGSMRELRQRLNKETKVQENYSRMFLQAENFMRLYGDWMSIENLSHLRAFLSLPMKSPLRRFRTICRHSLYKSSRLQTLAQCITMKDRRSL